MWALASSAHSVAASRRQISISSPRRGCVIRDFTPPRCARRRAQLTGRPSLATGRKTFMYNTPLVALPEGSAPDLKNKSFTITADLEIPPAGADGMIFTQGGITAGWGFY